MTELTAEPCSTEPAQLGESCRWDPASGELLWIDALRGVLYRATAAGTTVKVIRWYHVPGQLTAIAPVAGADNGWIIAANQSISHLADDGAITDLAAPEAANAAEVRMNDAACDPQGRFWVGSMAYDERTEAGSVYRFHPSSGAVKVFGNTTVSNGIGWSPDGTTMYFADSGPGTVEVFDFDPEHGDLSNRRLLIELDGTAEGVPDGLCVDTEGALWVAIWGGSEVRRYSPAGELLSRVQVPTSQPSSCAIGGTSGTTLYITTAREGLSPARLLAEPDAGRLFCADVGVAGLPVNCYRHLPERT